MDFCTLVKKIPKNPSPISSLFLQKDSLFLPQKLIHKSLLVFPFQMAPVTEHQGSFLSRISRRNQIVSMDVNHDQELKELEDFQKHVAQRFTELLSPSGESDPILSIQWLRKLLDAFMSCESGFQSVLTANPAQISKPLVPETLDRIVKALDICTAVVNGADSVRQSQRLAEIAVTALKQQPLSDGSVRRAKRALTSLLAALNADKNSGGSGRRATTTEQSSSFGRGSGGGGCVSKNWSASKQIQAMAANLALPRGGEASPMFIMSSVMVMVMWTLVAAVPCQASNGLTVHLPLPRHQVWASAAASIQERIGEELKRKEKRCGGGGGGLMEEMQRMERVGLKLMEFADGFRFDGEEEVKAEVEELEEICRKMEDGLDGLQRQVRQVFHRLVKSRSEILEAIDHCNI